MTTSDFAAAKKLVVRSNFEEMIVLSYGQLDDYAQHATNRQFTIPIARTYSAEEWRAALKLS